MMIWPNSVDELSVRRTFSVALMYSVVPTIHPSSRKLCVNVMWVKKKPTFLAEVGFINKNVTKWISKRLSLLKFVGKSTPC